MPAIPSSLLILIFMLTLSGLLSNATPAFACSCAETIPAEQFADATTVFVGTVKNITENGRQRFVNFDVSESRKGLVTENVTVITGWGGGDCGFHFETGNQYLVYTRGQEQLTTNICLGTSLLVANVQTDDANNQEMPIVKTKKPSYSLIIFTIIALTFLGASTLISNLIRRKNNIIS